MVSLGEIKRKVMIITKMKLIASLSEEKLLESLADLEHKRWSKWQEYVHSKCIKNSDGSLTIPKESVTLWENEIITPYENLTETQKESDRKEIRLFLSLIKSYLNEKFY